jgi:hypothetical protein
MSTDENKALVRREYEQGVNQGDFDVRNEVLASNYVAHFSGLSNPGDRSLRTIHIRLLHGLS